MTTSSRRCARRRPRLLGALILLSLLSGAARAEEPLTFKERYERTVAVFKSGQYDKAIVEFQALYQERPLPLLLFNLAQSHRKAGHPREALDLYERFLREDPKTDLRGETEGYITEVKEVIRAEEAAAERAERERAERERAALIAKALAEEPPPTGFDRSGRPIVSPKRPLRILKWMATGAGVLAAAGGGALLALNGRGTCALGPGQELCPQQLDTFVGGITAVSVGGALLAGAVVLFVLDYRQNRELTMLPRPSALRFAFDLNLGRDAQAATLTLLGRF